jgi:hypothetical protein
MASPVAHSGTHIKFHIRPLLKGSSIKEMSSQSQSAILLWSEHSDKCAQLRQMMNEEQLRLFEKVCVDNDQIRNMICGSDKLQIKFLPCFLILDAQKNLLAKFEGVDALKWYSQNLQKSLPPSPSPPSHSRVDQILEGMQQLPRSQLPESQEFSGPPLAGPQSRGPPNITRPRGMPDIGRPLRGGSMLSSDRGMVDEDGEISMPVRGEGHENMRSSLVDYGQQEDDPSGMGLMTSQREDPEPRMVPVGNSKNPIMIEDLTPDEDEPQFATPDFGDDPSGMSMPRGDIPIAGQPSAKSTNADDIVNRMGKMGGRSNGKQAALKESAAAMAAQRDSDMEQANQRRQAKMQPQRNQGKRKAIRLDE